MLVIIADLKNRKLLLRYINAGIDVSVYETDLNRVVFLLSGIKSENQYTELKDWYYKQIDQVNNVDIRDSEKINKMAGEIVIGLMERRQMKA